MTKYGILGGGWAGLLTAHAIKTNFPSLEVEVIEKAKLNELGGLLRSVTLDGFTYDIGGPHILFSRNKDILQSILNILGNNYKVMERKNFIHFEGKLIPYPFENGIHKLSKQDRAMIGLGIVENLIRLKKETNWAPKTFYEWIYGIFGEEMGSRYLEPYNNKIWKRNLKQIDADWVFTPGRLPLPELSDIIYSIAGISTIGYKEQANFYYPKVGGIQALYNSLKEQVLEEGINIVSDTNISNVTYSEDKKWVINAQFKYEKIFNTLPVNILLGILDGPEYIHSLAKKLDYNRVIVVGYALSVETPEETTVYVPDKDIIFHRYTWMSNLIPASVAGKSNLIVEVTWPKDSKLDIGLIVEECTEGLLKLGIISTKESIIHTKSWVHEFGYPIYNIGHQRVREEIFNYLDSLGIKSVGRWGSWHYWTTDTVYEAVDLVMQSLSGDLNGL